MKAKELGIWGEEMAKIYLKKKGYKILDTNYKVVFSGRKFGEIDIVAQKRGLFKKHPICFVEVKTIFGDSDFLPEDKIDFKKQKKLKKLAEIYLESKKISPKQFYQIDLISIRVDPQTLDPIFSHFENVIEEKNDYEKI
jgi:putative endonuclease